MTEKRKRHFLRSKEGKDLLKDASDKLKINLDKIYGGKSKIEVIQTDLGEIYSINGRATIIKTGEKLIPTLISEEMLKAFPKVVVDMGALPYVCKGANIMAPGIRRFEGEFSRGSLVFIIDEKHRKAIAVGEILYDMEDAENVKQGIVVKNLHYVGDRIWNMLKEIGALT